jgi:type I restriction enzyme R subunit
MDAGMEFFTRWRTIDAEEPVSDAIPQMKLAIHGVFDQSRVLELIEFFVDFGHVDGALRKRLARYNQYWGVSNGVAGVVTAMTEGHRKGGIVFHGQGSGKSMELLLIANRLMRMAEMGNPTIVVLSDRNDLDNQLFDDEFAPSKILPETPVQADSRPDLRKLLTRASGGIIVTTLQKFGIAPDDRDRDPLITDRSNIVVMVDEAHRSQYGLATGLAADMRRALPNATYLAATGTPVELLDRSTSAVFGDTVSVYTPGQAVEDGAVVPIFYVSRVAKIRLSEEAENALNVAVKQMTDEVTEEDQRRAIREWSSIDAILSADPVVDRIVDDVLEHSEKRRALTSGKSMLVGMSRAMAAKMYAKIVERRPDWHNADDMKGKIKVVYTGSAADEPEIRRHVRSPQALRNLKKRATDPASDLEMVVVCDRWLTGFDSPSLHTMYLAKLMKGHGRFQAVTRPNRSTRTSRRG